ncbi:MAG: hypothetical protein QXF59_05645 [Candidatus Bathyarchaeia archaeon]|nr:hypothetical protein [Candidatus Bathyarchaeota archaeon]
MGLAQKMFEKWIEENRDRIGLYFRGKGSPNLKLKCPLCGRQLHKRNFTGKFECKNPKCKLIRVELKNGEVRIQIEPFVDLKYDLTHLIRIEV